MVGMVERKKFILTGRQPYIQAEKDIFMGQIKPPSHKLICDLYL